MKSLSLVMKHLRLEVNEGICGPDDELFYGNARLGAAVPLPAVCRTSARWALRLARGGREDRSAQRSGLGTHFAPARGAIFPRAVHPLMRPDSVPAALFTPRRAVMLDVMSDVTRILAAIEQGDPAAAEQLLPLVYDELRKLAAAKLAQEKPGQTLQATALVHEAYVRLVDVDKIQQWNNRGHFFAAAAEAMRRILVGKARRRR